MLAPVQLSLGTPLYQESITTPLNEPKVGETLVLLEHGGVPFAYAVGADRQPRHITPSQLLKALECDAEAPAQPLPADTNRRVMAAFERARQDVESRLGRDRRAGSDTRLRRYLNRQFRLLRERQRENEDELRRVGILQQVFADDLPPRVAEAIEEMRRLNLSGESLVRRLEALRALYRLNPPDEEEGGGPKEVGVLRIVCSNGLVQE
jgi:hypothetical protein